MKFSVGQLAKAFDLSPQALRYYEARGVLTPDRDSNNSYRKYDFKDLVNIAVIKRYQNMGMSINEIIKIQSSTSQSELIDSLNDKIDALNKEILLKQLFIEHISVIQARMKDIEKKLNKPEIIHGDTYYISKYHDSNDMVKSQLNNKTTRYLFSLMPITSTTTIIETQKNKKNEFKRGIVFNEKCLNVLSLPQDSLDSFDIIKANRFVRCALLLMDGILSEEILNKILFPFITNNNLQISGNMFTIQLLDYRQDENNYYHYTDIMVPVD